MSKQEEIIEVCGKKVAVRYARTQEEACASCAFCSRKECHDLDCNMRDIIGESVCRYAYFVDAEQQEEKDYKRLYKELVNSEWYKKYYQGASVGGSVAVERPEADLDAEIFAWQKAHATEETKQIIAMTARHFAEWGAEHADKPIYEVSSKGKSAMGDKFFDWLQFGTHAIWDWMVKTDWYKKLNDMSDELIVKIYLGKKRKKKQLKR